MARTVQAEEAGSDAGTYPTDTDGSSARRGDCHGSSGTGDGDEATYPSESAT